MNDIEIAHQFGNWLMAQREMRSMTLEYVAFVTGLANHRLSELENGSAIERITEDEASVLGSIFGLEIQVILNRAQAKLLAKQDSVQ